MARETIDLREVPLGLTAVVVSTSFAPQSFMRLLKAWDDGQRSGGRAEGCNVARGLKVVNVAQQGVRVEGERRSKSARHRSRSGRRKFGNRVEKAGGGHP